MQSFTDYINEASLGRFWQHYTKGEPIAIVSAERQDKNVTKEENKDNTDLLRKFVFDAKFGYVKCKGGYTETRADGSEEHVDNENSTIIYCTKEREKELFKFAFYLGERFKQDSILFIDSDGNAAWHYTQHSTKHPKGSVERLGEFHPVQIGKYYSKIGKKHFTFSEFKEVPIPTRKTTIEMRTEDDTLECIQYAIDHDISLSEAIEALS